MYTLGINAAYHDPAACLVRDGEVVAAAEEERFTRIKHGKRPVPFSTWELPFHAIDYCLREAGIRLADVDHVAYSYDPFLLPGARRDAEVRLPLEPSAHAASDGWESVWDPLFFSSIVNAPRQLAGGAPHHLQERFRGVSFDGPFRWHFLSHHLAHAASAFHASPFERAAVMTLDGRGERATTSYGTGCNNALELIGEVHMPHSLGVLYERVTEHLGFLHSSDEYKVMALAAFGRRRYAEEFREIIRLRGNGDYTIEPLRLAERFGPARRRGEPILERHRDLAHSLQKALEEAVLEIARWLHAATGERNLAMAGGVALNCVMNDRLRREGPFDQVWVQPAAGDAGTALGAALWIDAQVRGGAERRFRMDHAFLGPGYSDEEIEGLLRWSRAPWRRMRDFAGEVADLLAREKVVGFFRGRMEFGPRALGARSILASPIPGCMQARLNEIKDREDFRPVAPMVLEEEAENWFRGAGVSPFMLFVAEVLPERAEQIPAVRHVDGTARVQTVSAAYDPERHALLRAFEARTGVPVLVNTSFNTRGEPMVCSPRDALECFWTSPLDALAIGPFLIEKQGRRE
jgi:carbamoyltransferase